MKRNYLAPAMEIEQTEIAQMISLSIVEGGSAQPTPDSGENGDGLAHEEKDWNIWNED